MTFAGAPFPSDVGKCGTFFTFVSRRTMPSVPRVGDDRQMVSMAAWDDVFFGAMSWPGHTEDTLGSHRR